MSELSVVEVQRLEVLESVINAGMQTFVHVGNALLEIRDSRLYRQTHDTFEEYCRERWEFNSSHARRLIAAAEVVVNIKNAPIRSTFLPNNTAAILPATETQTRPLTSLPPEQQPAVWQRAVETAPNGKITQAHVQAVVDAHRGGEAIEKSNSQPHVTYNTGDNEWYTPVEYMEAARQLLGEIDLDPASSETANAIVNAKLFFTSNDDGLAQHWFGRVWMNPPYASGLIERFSEKLVMHYKSGDVSQAIVLVNNATETAWFHQMASVAQCICFPRGRIRFWKPDGKLGAPLQGQSIIYMGQNAAGFVDVFKKFGLVVML